MWIANPPLDGTDCKSVPVGQDRINTVTNIVGAMSGIVGIKKDEIINRQLCHFFRVDKNLGLEVAKGLGIKIDEKMMQ